ncbi:MAG: hypothetical protein K1Y02_21095 [Candidatus Hydrogenedentes bacterium]|nr:hypothetical protein [Candidatus Hydrogenedentota bacterium]
MSTAIRLFFVGVLVAISAWGQAAGDAPSPIALEPGARQLFLDDAVIAKMSGLTRTMHQPEKRGAVLKPDIPTDGDLIQIRGEPVWIPEEGVYKILYFACARDPKYSFGIALATSKDGLHWDKPNLGLVEALGSKDNNWIAIPEEIAWPENAMEGFVYDPDDPNPAHRYKGLMGATRRRPVVSPDCIHWSPLGDAVIPSSDEGHLLHDRAHKQYCAIVKTGNEYGRAFSIATSTDFEHWTPNRLLFGADAIDQKMAPDVINRRLNNPNMLGPFFVEPNPAVTPVPNDGLMHQPIWRAEVYNVGVFTYEGFYIGLPSMYYPTATCLPERNNTDGFHEIQLIASRDLNSWIRLGDRKPFIECSGIEKGRIGVYDRTQILAANAPLVKDDELWFYYSGLKWRDSNYGLNKDGSPRDPATLTDEERADLKDGWGAACLAVLRRDGFVSLDSGYFAGSLTTRPFKLNGKRLYINAAAAKGQVTVELMSKDGRSIRGYSDSDCTPVVGDRVRAEVTWKDGADIASLSGQEIQLEFCLKSASLYSFWME